MIKKKLSVTLLIACTLYLNIHAQVDSNFYCFLLFGQSNMAGGYSWRSGLIAADCDTNSRIKVLAFDNCGTNYNSCKTNNITRTYNQWYTARPPLHDCGEGICPGDYFAKTLIDSIPVNAKIGLIPCALSGMALNVFLKNSTGKSTVGPSAVNGKNAYQWLLDRCKLAQKTGVIKGMLLHQGESGTGSNQAWDDMAIQIFNDLKTDLGLDKNTPVVVGELRTDNTPPAPQYNAGTNKLIDGMATKYPHCAVASSQGLKGNGSDIWHFTAESFREFGKRYAKGLLSVASPTIISRKGTVVVTYEKNTRNASKQTIVEWKNDARIFTLNGRLVSSVNTSKKAQSAQELRSGNVYLVRNSSGNGVKFLIAP